MDVETNKGEATQNAIEIDDDIQETEEETETATAKYAKHGVKLLVVAKKGKTTGQESFHYKCNYCSMLFIGPGSGSFLDHLRKLHPKKCLELLSNSKPVTDFFSKAKMKASFDEDIALGKLLKWIVKTNQSFTTVVNEFEDKFTAHFGNHNLAKETDANLCKLKQGKLSIIYVNNNTLGAF